MTGKPDRAILEGWWTQVGKNASIKDLKRRCVDTLNAAGFQVDDGDVRMWLYNTDDDTKDEKLYQACKQISKGGTLVEPAPEMADEGEDKVEFETNSGVDFPGQCLEPLMKSALRVSSLTLNQNQ